MECVTVMLDMSGTIAQHVRLNPVLTDKQTETQTDRKTDDRHTDTQTDK